MATETDSYGASHILCKCAELLRGSAGPPTLRRAQHGLVGLRCIARAASREAQAARIRRGNAAEHTCGGAVVCADASRGPVVDLLCFEVNRRPPAVDGKRCAGRLVFVRAIRASSG